MEDSKLVESLYTICYADRRVATQLNDPDLGTVIATSKETAVDKARLGDWKELYVPVKPLLELHAYLKS